jgi:hypothetical protein
MKCIQQLWSLTKAIQQGTIGTKELDKILVDAIPNASTVYTRQNEREEWALQLMYLPVTVKDSAVLPPYFLLPF